MEVRIRRRGKCQHFLTRQRSGIIPSLARDTLALLFLARDTLALLFLARDTLALPGLKAPLARRFLWVIIAVFALAATADKGTEVRELEWEDLLPPDQEPPASTTWLDHSAIPSFDNFQIPTGIVPELNGQMVKIPGYMVPLDLVEGKVTSSLLVPYFGACIHVPPPPPNQIVHVKFEEPVEIDSIWDPVWVTGKLGLERFAADFVEAGYSMEGEGIEAYQY